MVHTVPRQASPPRLLHAVLCVSALALVISSSAGAVGRYPDPSGDSSSAPDLRGADVRRSGTALTFLVHHNRAALANDEFVAVAMDTDLNAATGRRGLDWLLLVYSRDRTRTARWNGSSWVLGASRSLQATGAPNALTLRIDAGEFGIGNSLRVIVIAKKGTADDRLPERGAVSYRTGDENPQKALPPTFQVRPVVYLRHVQRGRNSVIARYSLHGTGRDAKAVIRVFRGTRVVKTARTGWVLAGRNRVFRWRGKGATRICVTPYDRASGKGTTVCKKPR
jgi:hypothetical protein